MASITPNPPLPTKLPVAMTIETIEPLAALFRDIIKTPQATTLDASDVEIITSPGAQLLVALSKTLEVQDIALKIRGARASFIQVLTQLGLGSYYSQWEMSHD